MTDVKKGDRYMWEHVHVEVRRVSKAGAWADIRVSDGNGSWSKRQPLPFPDTFKKYWGSW